MGFPLVRGGASVGPYLSCFAAGALEPKPDPSQGVAPDPSVVDTERDPLYSDGVKRHAEIVDGFRSGRKDASASHAASLTTRTTPASETDRLARLSRWQRVPLDGAA